MTRFSWRLAVFTTLIAVLLPAESAAQNNSLFQRARSARAANTRAANGIPDAASAARPLSPVRQAADLNPATATPVDQARTTLAGARSSLTAVAPDTTALTPNVAPLGLPPGPGGPSSGAAATAQAMQNSANPALLAISPIAVVEPQKERIRPGALVTVIVRETKQALTDSNLRSQKQWDFGAELKAFLRLDTSNNLITQNFPNGTPKAEWELQDNYQGRGRVDRRDELITRITASVIDVKPNGTLVLEAKKSIEMDEETQVYTLTGLCRIEDLTPENTILSTQVADLRLSVQHEGAARDAAKRGIFKKLTDLFRLS